MISSTSPNKKGMLPAFQTSAERNGKISQVSMAMFWRNKSKNTPRFPLCAFRFSNIKNILCAYLTARKWIRRQRKLDNVIVVGDSHVNFFSGNEHISFTPFYYRLGKDFFRKKIYINTCSDKLEHFSTLHLGPCLAYSVCREQSSFLVKEKLLFLFENKIIPRGARVLFCFGEIDIRVHILKWAAKQQKSCSEISEEVIECYLSQLVEFQSKYGIHVCCWSPPPSQNEKVPFNEEFPSYGTEVERNEATLIFEGILKDKCKKYNFTFASITRQLIDENRKTKLEFISDDFCHLSQKAWGVGADSLAHAELKNKGLL